MFLINVVLIFRIAYYLNPKYQYDHNIALDEELLMALRNVVYRRESDLDLAVEVISWRSGTTCCSRKKEEIKENQICASA